MKEERTNSKKYVVAFKGLNLGEGWQDGEMSDCRNLSSMKAPCVTQRYARVMDTAYPEATTVAVKEGLVVIAPPLIYYNGKSFGDLTAGKKHTAVVGNYVCIFPDKKYFNVETEEYGSMDETLVTGDFEVTFTDSTITLVTGEFPFRVGDAIRISGCTNNPENNKTIIIRDVHENVITVYENTLTAGDEPNAITFAREVPDMDVICECNYRLWGAKGDTIYASKYSDPLNFNHFDGQTGDSYAIQVSSEGEFTGAIQYSTHVCFFKEHCLHKMYGSKPSNFQIVTSQIHGVQAGSERSLVNVNETLMYKGINGVYAYTGGVPELVSECFGTVKFSEACATSDGERYYISMRNADTWYLMTYDALRNIWLREDDLHCTDMAFHDGYVWLLDADGNLWKVDPDADRSDIEWSMTLCPFNETMNERKGFSKFSLRLELAAGAWLKMEIKRDNATKWQTVYTTHNERARTINVPILPERCDSVEIRISGKGECLIRTFVREFSVGSDV